MLQSREIEELVMRVAMKGRAVGIHMIIASQRPSVNVFTGVIKANFPSRACLSVASTVDSKNVLDEAGAEKLSLYGDMLYSSIRLDEKPMRVQVPYISELEMIKRIK